MPTSDELVVKVSTGGNVGYPDPVGRHGNAVMAEPAVFLETNEGEFQFTKCLVVRVWDDSAMLDDEGVFEGDTFRTYSESPLLTTLHHLREISALFHYRLFLDSGSTVVDVICRKAPYISLRTFGRGELA